jgi:thiamine pyrophosphate-dependent acetolactate synthase large subunit-like protein
MPRTRVTAAAVVGALAQHGVELCFGIPGTHSIPFYRHLADSGIRHVAARHEQGAGYAADGYARVTGRPAVVLVTTGPGVLNAATAAATAYADSIPMMVLSPGLPLALDGAGTGYLHETKSQTGAMNSVCEWSRRVNSPADAVRAVHDAFTVFEQGRPRPVHIEVPVDVLDCEADADLSVPPRAPGGPVPDRAAIAHAVKLLSAAHRPAIITGGGGRGASAWLRRLAESVDAPVVSTVNGKGVLDELHPLSVGASIRLQSAKALVADADVVVAVGTELADTDLWTGPLQLGGDLIRIDIDPGQLHRNAAATCPLPGDAALTLAELCALLPGEARRPGREPGASRAAAARQAIEQEARADAGQLAELCAALRDTIADDAIVTGDSSRCCYLGAVHFLPARGPSRFLYPTGYATLGYAVPAAIGAKLADPGRQVLALTGEGGLLFTVQELAVAAELGLPLPVVTDINGGYQEIRDAMIAAGVKPAGVTLPAPRAGDLAAAFGCRGEDVFSVQQLGPAVARALTAPGPTVLGWHHQAGPPGPAGQRDAP